MDQQIGFPKVVNDEYQSILSESSPKNWAIFGYEKMTNDLKVLGSGEDGLEELAEEWDDSKILYAFARVIEPISKLPKFVFISWCGDGVPVAKKGLFHHHVNDAVRYFKGFHCHINARAEVDVTPAAILKKVQDSSGAKYSIHNEGGYKPAPAPPVGSSYTPVQTTPKPLGSAPPAFNKPTTSAPQFNRPSVGAVPSYGQPRVSNTSSPFNKQFSSPAPVPAPVPVSVPAPVTAPSPISTLKGLCATAVFTYEANEANEIGFAEGDVISEIEKLDEGWWQGKNTKGQVGLFPSNYVEIKSAPTTSAVPPPLFNRPAAAATPVSTPATAVPSRPSAGAATSPSYQPYMNSSANKWLGDDDEPRASKTSPYNASFPGSTPAEDRVAAEKERREREDRELRERAAAEEREREARERKEAQEKEEKQRAAALAAATTFAAAPPAPPAAAAVGITARAIYDYSAQEGNEISFAEGDLITAIEKADPDWWQGQNSAGQIGLFPATYVEEIKSSQSTSAPLPPAPPARPAVAQIEAIALYDYEATEPNEISFVTGDRITDIVLVSDDWWQGRVNGVDGLFPQNYVEIKK